MSNKIQCSYCGYVTDDKDTVCEACGHILMEKKLSVGNIGNVKGKDNLQRNFDEKPEVQERFTTADIVDRLRRAAVKVLTLTSSGSGFFIRYAGSEYLVTNFHVIEDSVRMKTLIQVLLPKETNPRENRYYARILACDPLNDVAILEVAAPLSSNVEYLSLADVNTVRQGDPVCTVGNPRHLEFDYLEGIVSNIDYRDENNMGMSCIICSLATTHGNSGGAVVRRSDCKVIGISSAIFKDEYLPDRTICVSTDAIVQLIHMMGGIKTEETAQPIIRERSTRYDQIFAEMCDKATRYDNVEPKTRARGERYDNKKGEF